jgi:tetratricopeptide (TPR) repeat protein
MRVQRGLFLALTAAVTVGACAPAATGGTAGGPRPAESRFTTAAKLQIAQAEAATGERQRELYQAALVQALQGVEAGPNNPQHFYLAGIAHAGLGTSRRADTMFNRALEMFPQYYEDVMIAREQAWAQASIEGVNAYNAGEHAGGDPVLGVGQRDLRSAPRSVLQPGGDLQPGGAVRRRDRAFEDAVAALEREPGRELTPEEQEDRAESLSALCRTSATCSSSPSSSRVRSAPSAASASSSPTTCRRAQPCGGAGASGPRDPRR